MKIFAHHDSTGSIYSLIGVDAPDGVDVMLEPEPGIVVTEIRGMEYGPDVGNVDAMREFAESHTISVQPVSPGTLVKKD